MQINVSFDSSVANAPAGFVAAVNYVVNYYDTLFTNNVTVNINVGYGEIAGQTMAAGALGATSVSYAGESYTSVVNALQADRLLAEGAPGATALPATSPLSGSLFMPQAEAQALGLTTAVSTSYVGFSSSLPFSYTPNATPASNQYYFVGVVEHEFSEALGRVSLISDQPSYYSPMDLDRYSAPGVRGVTAGGSGSTAYFSVDNGVTNLGTWNNNPSNGDLGDWYPSGPAAAGNDAFNDYTNPGAINLVSANDITLMQALGWTTQTTQPSGSVGVTANATAAVQGGAAITLLTGAPSRSRATRSPSTACRTVRWATASRRVGMPPRAR